MFKCNFRLLKYFKDNVLKWQKESYQKKYIVKLAMNEFYFDFLNTDFDIENDNDCFENIYTNDSDSK